MMITYLFPGQGSQICGMGQSLFEEFPELVAQADNILGYSIKKLCLEDPHQQLNQTQYTQPAIYTVNALTYFHKIRQGLPQPDYVAGHSLGEYNALLAADVYDFATGLQLIKKRGELMSQATGGGMAVIIGLKKEDLAALLANQFPDLVIANFNTYQQFVISGPKLSIEKAQNTLGKMGTFIPLKVSGPFHSHYMEWAQQQFAKFLENYEFFIPTRPVIANLDAQSYHPASIRTNLALQMTHAVKWTEIIEYFLSYTDMKFEEIGPGNVLTGLLKKIKNGQ